jgi:hypothetical protein
MADPSLDISDDAPGVAPVPSQIERLGGDAELNDEIAR